ncbi:MAG TPA: lipid II flippase MurJ [Polyangia bacterium]|nr:lipid II flippase MurJ [Polyangia bacterium]
MSRPTIPSIATSVVRVAPWRLASRAGAALLPILLAGWFGRSEATDFYSVVAALYTLVGALVFACFQDSALVRILVDVEREEPRALPRFVGALAAYTMAASLGLALVVGAATWLWFRVHVAPPLAPLVAPLMIGFSLSLVALALRSMMSTLLSARFRFVSESLGVAAGAVATIALAAALRGRGLGAMPFALAGGDLVALALLVVAARADGLRVELNWARSAPLRRLWRLMASEIGGATVVRVNPLVDQLMAQALGIVGGGTMLRLSGDLGNAGASLLGPLFLSILLSHLAVAGAEGDGRRFRATLTRSLALVTSVLGAFSALAILAREPLVRLVYGRGAMDAAALARIAHVLPYHLVGLAPLGALLVLARAHVSAGNSRILVGMGALNAALNLALNVALAPALGLEGIALSTSITSAIVAVIFWVRLPALESAPTLEAEKA